jgi:spore maturation protein CgeB
VRILLVHPGASWSTADVEDGLREGLEAQGATVVRYRLDGRIERAHSWLRTAWRGARKRDPTLIPPTAADVCYLASTDAIAVALRHQVDVVLVVSAMFFHPDAVILMRRAGLRVAALFTESPYDLAREVEMAARVDRSWTNERTSVDAFAAAGASCGYLPHAWHPRRHAPGAQAGDDDVAAHDVVFVGSGFPERVAWLEAVDWTGVDLGLYGHWTLARRSPLRRHVHGKTVPNTTAAALYRQAAIGLNLYRHADGAESLNPRAYELAACGCFHLSDARAEVGEVFGSRVPILEDPKTTGDQVRYWLAHPIARATIAAELPACVTSSTWTARAATVLEDCRALIQETGYAEVRREGRSRLHVDERVDGGDRDLPQQVVAGHGSGADRHHLVL